MSIFRRLKYAYQRAMYGVDDSMTWDLRSYILEHFKVLLVQYLEQSETFLYIEPEFRHYINSSVKALDELIDAEEESIPWNSLEYKRRERAVAAIFTSTNFVGLWN